MPEKQTHEAISVDVLIVGGGVMGLWLLNDLRDSGVGAALLERRDLGGEQTCHSHVYLHQGYLYNDVGLAARLKRTTAKWNEWLGQRRPRYWSACSHFGFRSEYDAVQKVRLWSDPRVNLKYVERQPSEWPEAVRGGAVRVLYETPESAIDGEWLVRELSCPVEDWISRIDGISGIRIDAGKVAEVEVVMTRGERLRFRPRAVVLAAGAGNAELLALASGGERQRISLFSGRHQLRKAHMLVVEGDKTDFPPLTGVFSMGGLFIVSRWVERRAVWLVSDNRSPNLGFVEDWTKYDGRWWLAQVWASLREMAPACFSRPERLRWGLYEAPKAEGRAEANIPHEERIERFGVENLWAVWPTKLTLAPLASESVTTAIREMPGFNPSPTVNASAWQSCRVSPGVAPERWAKTPRTPWDEFRSAYHLS